MMRLTWNTTQWDINYNDAHQMEQESFRFSRSPQQININLIPMEIQKSK